MGHNTRNIIGGDAATIKPKIVAGEKFWNVDPKNKALYEIEYGNQLKVIYEKVNEEHKRLTGKPLPDSEISKLRTHKDLGTWVMNKKPIQIRSGINAFLNPNYKGKAKVKKLSFGAWEPKKLNKHLVREFLESRKAADRLFKKQIKNLDILEEHKVAMAKLLQEGADAFEVKRLFNNRVKTLHNKMRKIVEETGNVYTPDNWAKYGWKLGQSEKNFWKWVRPGGTSYTAINELNAELAKKLGFEFDVGHFWASVGATGERTIMDSLFGGRMATGGMFSTENIAPQPRTPSLQQLMHPYWSNIVPNVPGFYDKHGYQVAGLEQLQDAYVGGAGWSGSLADYMMAPVDKDDWTAAIKKKGYRIDEAGQAYKDIPGKGRVVEAYNPHADINYQRISDLPEWQRSYVSFGDTTKAFYSPDGAEIRVGATPEIRLSQLERGILDFQQTSGTSQPNFHKFLTKTGSGYDQTAVDARTIAKQRAAKTRGTILPEYKLSNISRITGAGQLARYTKVASGLNRAESLARVAAGDYVGGGLGLIMTSPKFQQAAGELLLKQGFRLMPGVSFGSGALQAIGYMSGGQWTKSGLSLLGGIAGEFPGAGDAVQAAIELSLTGHDIATGEFQRVKKVPDEDNLVSAARTARKVKQIIP